MNVTDDGGKLKFTGTANQSIEVQVAGDTNNFLGSGFLERPVQLRDHRRWHGQLERRSLDDHVTIDGAAPLT